MKIRVGLFFGGNSVEHEISVITGLQAAEYIDKEKYEVVPVYITKYMVGHKLGEFAPTRTCRGHAGSKTGGK